MEFEVNSKAGAGISSHHPGGALVWPVAGGAMVLKHETPPEVVRALLTHAGGEIIQPPW